MTIQVTAHFPRMKRVPMSMTRELANTLLDGFSRGKYVSRLRVDAALRATGDLPPEASLPFKPFSRRMTYFGGTR